MKGCERIRITVALASGLIALGLLTWGIGQVYLDLVGHTNAVKSETPSKPVRGDNLSSDVLVLPEARFWTCQAGVFKNKSNAELRKEQLKVLNIESEIIGADPWLVCIGLGHSADDLQKLKQTLQERGVSTLTKQIVLSRQSFRITGKGSELTVGLLTNTNAILGSGLTSQTLAKEKELWNAGAGANPSKELEALHQVYEELRAGNQSDEQFSASLLLFFQYQMVINKFSGK